jgi:hypothetical protein
LLAICRMKTTVPHFGTFIRRPMPTSTVSTSSQTLLIGLENPPGNLGLTPSTFSFPWYLFAPWPETDETDPEEPRTPPDLRKLLES